MKDWDFWAWLAYGLFAIAAAISAADQGLKLSPDLGKELSWLTSKNIWAFTPLAFIVLATSIFVLRDFEIIGGKKPSTEYSNISNIPQSKTETLLRLQFRGGQQAPTELKAKNILQWYVVWSGESKIEMHDKNDKQVKDIYLPKTWVINIVFDKPISLKQFIVEPSSHLFPRYEVKVASPVLAIITTFGDDPPLGNVDFYAQLD